VSSAETISPSRPVEHRSESPSQATCTEDLVTVILSAVIIVGTFTDAWAHFNLLGELQEEGFFTPWHGLLYSGYAATAGWVVWLAFRRRRPGGRWWLDAWPVGYRLGAIGAAIFLVAGNADMVWHTVFGIEQSIEALVSPSHLALSAGGALLLTSPTRSWWAAGGGGLRSLTGIISLGFGTFAVAVFLLYVSAFDLVAPVRSHGGAQDTPDYYFAALGVASYLVTSAAIVLPLILSHRRRPTFGVTTALVTPLALFPAVVHEFPHTRTIGAALLVDWILIRLDRVRGIEAPHRLPIAGVTVAVVLTVAHLIALQFSDGIQWPVELWTGAITVAAAAGGLLGVLATQPAKIR
jgi:hypothetical protein